jgi:DNA-3-methyladenine glycosylase I
VQCFTFLILIGLTTIPFALSIVEGLRTVSNGCQEIRGSEGARRPELHYHAKLGRTITLLTMAVRKSKVAKRRCPWVDLDKPDYVEYHDKEWGVPVHDDRTMFEFLTLEAAQAGLSWYTVLRKREAYRKAFEQFHPERVARYGKREVASLLNNTGIIRNQQKIVAAINNAKCFLEVQAEFGSFHRYIWRFVNGKPIVHKLKRLRDYPPSSVESDALSKDLKQRCFKFVGSTICYAHMQATGMINDHVVDCFRRREIINSGSIDS